ncbi:MAG TPA: hypothetical protein DEG43_01110 [Acidimicrobiaceae bacterium]|nr:hypothetical protein [Acidimicrobiaceae bacterium]
MIAGQMTFVYSAWGVTAFAVGGYAVSVIRRGKKLSNQVPAEKRRWL